MIQEPIASTLAVIAAAVPDGWVEAVATIIVTVLSWWLGERRGINKARKRRRHDDPDHLPDGE